MKKVSGKDAPRISGLFIYPLKSGAACPVQTMDFGKYGPEFDRLWMVYRRDEDSQVNQMVRQNDRSRANGKMALLQPTDWGRDYILLHAPGLSRQFECRADVQDGQVVPVRMHSDADLAPVVDAGDEAAEFISDYLGGEYRLGCLSARENRRADRVWMHGNARPLSLGDGFHLLVTNEASLESLRPHFSDAAEGITMDRFRPNIVISGWPAWQEDVVATMSAGSATLEFVKPCARCTITTIDQKTGLASGMEPFETLKRMRFGKHAGDAYNRNLAGAFFGQNAVPLQGAGLISGQAVKILDTADMNPAVAQSRLLFEPSV